MLSLSLFIHNFHPVVLRCIYGSSEIRVWADQQKTVPVTLPAVYFSRASVPSELWVEGYEVSDSLRDITLRWWWNGFVDEIKATVYAVDDVQWETYPDNVYVPGENPPGCPVDNG